MKDHPNPLANIGFICFTPFHYFVYKNIYRHLQNAEFVIGDLYGSLSEKEERIRIQQLGSFLNRQKVYWRCIDSSNKYLQAEEYAKYGLLVSCLYKGAITEEYNLSKKKVRVLYGNAKDTWNFGAWNAFFDVVLSYGPYSQKYLRNYGNAKMVGNPKFDDWFGNRISVGESETIKKEIDKRKKTVLVLPTYGVLSSQNILFPLLTKITQKYNVIIKFHSNTFLYEKEIVDKYKKANIILKTDEDDMLPLLKIADVGISDNSGAIFDALWADVPLVSVETDIKKNSTSMHYDKNNTHLGVATNDASLEQKIKKKPLAIGPVLRISELFLSLSLEKQCQLLEEALIEAMQNKQMYIRNKQKLKKNLFVSTPAAGKQAAQVILNLLYGKSPKKNLLSQSIVGYMQYAAYLQKRQVDTIEKNQTIMFYTKIRSLPFFRRLFFVFKEFF